MADAPCYVEASVRRGLPALVRHVHLTPVRAVAIAKAIAEQEPEAVASVCVRNRGVVAVAVIGACRRDPEGRQRRHNRLSWVAPDAPRRLLSQVQAERLVAQIVQDVEETVAQTVTR